MSITSDKMDFLIPQRADDGMPLVIAARDTTRSSLSLRRSRTGCAPGR